ncbi:MAG: hypothetical protein IPK20_21310 [Betaproteobacteria bacterium]|nr:hypothetical protein [Betaproteobacteria bacterium]
MKQLAHQTSGAARRASPVSHSGNPDRSIEWLHRVLRTQAAISWSVVVGSAAVVMLSDRLKDGPGTAIVALSGVAAFLYYGWRSDSVGDLRVDHGWGDRKSASGRNQGETGTGMAAGTPGGGVNDERVMGGPERSIL